MKAIPFAYAIATSAVALVCRAAGGFAQQVTGILGSPGRRPPSTANSFPAQSAIWRRHQGESVRVDALVGAARRAAEGRAERFAYHDGRRRLRRAEHLRRRRPQSGSGSHRKGRAALHELPLDLAVLADAGGADHGSQSPRRWLRRRGRNRHGLSGLRLDHSESQRHHWQDPEGERIRDRVVRQRPQHAVLSGDPGWALQSVAGWNGLRIFLWLCWRRREPVAAEPLSATRPRSILSRAIPAGISQPPWPTRPSST